MASCAFLLGIITTLLVADASPVRAQTPESTPQDTPIFLSAAIGYHFSTGDYGGSSNTDIHFVPLTLTAQRDFAVLRLTLPYINVSGIESLIDTGGTVLTQDGDGLGDVTLDGTYTIDPWTDWMPHVDLNGRIKFPTANEDDGLGTGEFDYQLEIGAMQQFGPLIPYAGVGYRFVGSSSDFDLDDVVLASLGATLQATDDVDAGFFVFYQESASDLADDQLDLMPYVDWRITDSWSLNSYVTAGVLDGSPDFGIGLQLTYTAAYPP